jgi:hypothetical protein
MQQGSDGLLMKRFIPILGALGFLVFAIHRAAGQQSLLSAQIGAQPESTPSPSPTPPPGTTVGPSDIGPSSTYHSISALIGAGTGAQFNFKCGTYSMNPGVLVPGTGDTGIVTVPASDTLLGQNADGSWPSGALAARPATPPCVHISGAIPLTHWVQSTVNLIPGPGTETAWYDSADVTSVNVIGQQGATNTTAANGSCVESTVLNSTANTNDATYGTNRLWSPGMAVTASGINSRVVDAYGDTWQAGAACTTGSNGPNWGNGVLPISLLSQQTSDGTCTWSILAVAAPLPPNAATTHAMGGCSFNQELFYTSAANNSTTHPFLKFRSLAWPPLPTTWYMDMEGIGGHNKYVVWTADDPTVAGTTVELTGPLPGAFKVQSAGVTIENFTIEKFSTQNQLQGVIQMPNSSSNGDVINGNWISHNHGAGIVALNGAVNPAVTYNVFDAMGQNAWDSGGPANVTGLTFSYNLLQRNNEDNVTPGWDASALKFSNISNSVISNNESRFNNGNGLWCDSFCGSSNTGIWDSTTITLDHNNIHDNYGEAIRFEIGQGAVITNNTISNNLWLGSNLCEAPHVPRSLGGVDGCLDTSSGGYAGSCVPSNQFSNEIAVALSGNSTIGGSGSGNTITSKCGGIMLSIGTRTGLYCASTPCNTANNTVSYNTTTYTGAAATIPQVQGLSTNNAAGILTGLTWDHNTYHMGGASGTGFTGAQKDWQTATGSNLQMPFASPTPSWQAVGYDMSGSASN